MKKFEMRQLKDAIEYAAQGGQALHIHTLNNGHFLFKRYPVIGHLFDQDRNRLVYLVGRLGVNVIKIEREGTPKQHIDLCGKPFDLAVALCDAMNETLDRTMFGVVGDGDISEYVRGKSQIEPKMEPK
jgi:hypothetical protein